METQEAPLSKQRLAQAQEVHALTEVVTRVRRVLRASVRTEIPWESLPMAQIEVLQRLAEDPGIRVSDLARRHRLATNTVSTIVRQMLAADLIIRETAVDDRRASSLSMTEKGGAELERWLLANRMLLGSALSALPAEQQLSIEAALPALFSLAEELERASAL